MNWGLKIVIGLATFIVFIVSMGIYMVSKDTDSLVDNDYYEKSLSYDFLSGSWSLEIDWVGDGKAYISNHPVFL